MKLPPRYLTVIGLVLAFSALLLDNTITSALAPLIGEDATTKLAALGTLLAAIGRAIIPTKTEQEGKEPAP